MAATVTIRDEVHRGPPDLVVRLQGKNGRRHVARRQHR